jgi:hypothetical protein
MVLRQKYWIDGEVQGILVGRVLVYAAVAVTYVVVGSFCFQYWKYPDWTLHEHVGQLFHQFWPWMPSCLLLMPLVMHDVVRLSNLFAGPVYRLRQHLSELIANPNCHPLKFREDDYWQDLVGPINQLQNEIIALRMVVDTLVKQPLTTDEACKTPTCYGLESIDVERSGCGR